MGSFTPWTDFEIKRASDEELVSYIREANAHGRPESGNRVCGRLLHRYEGMVLAKAGAKMGWADAKEVAQEVQLQTVRAIYSDKQIAVFKAYVIGITNNVIANFHRNREGLPTLDPLPSEHERDEDSWGHERGESESGYESVESRLEADSARQTLEAVLGARNPGHRFVIEEFVLADSDASAHAVANAAQGKGYDISEHNVYKIKERFLTDYEAALRDAGFGLGKPGSPEGEAA
jgi:DNA-directed RNA polymerase specialized sigma24 family protein